MNNIIEGVKVYYDGSHFIAILPGYFKGKKKGKNKEYLVEVDGKVVDLKEAYNKANESNKGKISKGTCFLLFDEFFKLFLVCEKPFHFIRNGFSTLLLLFAFVRFVCLVVSFL